MAINIFLFINFDVELRAGELTFFLNPLIWFDYSRFYYDQVT